MAKKTIKTKENITKVANVLLEISEYYFEKAEENGDDIQRYLEEAEIEAENLPNDEFLELLKSA